MQMFGENHVRGFAGLSLIVMLLLVGCATGSAGPVAAPGEDRWFIQRAHAYLSERMGVSSPADEFLVRRVERDRLGKVHLQLVQRADAVPVWGRVLRLHMEENGAVYRVDGEVVQGLAGFRLPPLIEAEEAVRRGLAPGRDHLRSRSRGLFLYVENIERGVIPVYEIEVMDGLRRHLFLLDARSGAVVRRIEGSPH